MSDMLHSINYTISHMQQLDILASSGWLGGRCKFVNMRFVGLWHVCRGLGNREPVPCDFVCEGIFTSAVSEVIRKPTF
jgi:hypothetical protein